MSETMMTQRRDKDRLSDLPDCVLLYILSFYLNSNEAVQTCTLSKRWKNLWKHLPVLSVTSSQFKTLEGFTNFVPKFLSLRDTSIALRFLNFCSFEIVEPCMVKNILKDVVSHDVRKLRIHFKCDIQKFPIHSLSCHTLKTLRFSVWPKTKTNITPKILFPNSLNLPSLTSLYLDFIAFCGGAEPFSVFPKLKRLMITSFEIQGEENLSISSTTLVELTIRSYHSPITRDNNYPKIELCTPSLCSFALFGTPFQILRGSQFRSIKRIQIYATMFRNYVEPPSILLSWLLELDDLKTLKLSSSTLQVLYLVPDLLKVKLHSLCNLKSLKVDMIRLLSSSSEALINAKRAQMPDMSLKEVAKLQETFKEGSSSIPDGIIEFLLQNSPTAKVRYSKVKGAL